jgi:hypothetical protein
VQTGKFSDLKVDVNLPDIAPQGNYEIKLVSSVDGGENGGASVFCVHVALDLTDADEKTHVYEPLSTM